MKPKINSTSFGSITVKEKTFENDILIRMSGQIEKRRKKLSKKVYGTSHKISLAEAKYIYEKGAEKIIIGTGQTGYVELSKKRGSFSRRRTSRQNSFALRKRSNYGTKAKENS